MQRHYSLIASKVPSSIKLESRVKNYSRWVNNVEVEQEVQVTPFIEEQQTIHNPPTNQEEGRR